VPGTPNPAPPLDERSKHVQETEALPTVYHYRLEFFDAQRRPVQEVALTSADFARAVEAAFFDGLRHGVWTAYDPPLGRERIEPHFADPEAGSPQSKGFDVVLPTPDGGAYRVAFASTFFGTRAIRLGADLVRVGRLAKGSRLLYQLAAYLDAAEEKPRRGLRIAVEPASMAVPLRPGSRRDLGVAEAWDSPGPDDFPVVVPRRVIEESVEEARRTPDREIGGVLLGHLRRDPETGDVFLQATCQVPAEQTEATTTSVTFTPETWARVREVQELRGEGEVFAGWVHSHPFRFCAECPLPTPAECIDKVLFYSSDDEFLMEQAFARPFMVGLLTAVEPKLEQTLGHAPVKLYGWRHGEVVSRGFEVIDD
jgi:proteasome lid subunit RPN8/RPN11